MERRLPDDPRIPLVGGQKVASALLGGMVDHLGSIALLDDGATIHKHHAVGHVAGKGHLVGDNGHGHGLVGQVADDA